MESYDSGKFFKPLFLLSTASLQYLTIVYVWISTLENIIKFGPYYETKSLFSIIWLHMFSKKMKTPFHAESMEALFLKKGGVIRSRKTFMLFEPYTGVRSWRTRLYSMKWVCLLFSDRLQKNISEVKFFLWSYGNYFFKDQSRNFVKKYGTAISETNGVLWSWKWLHYPVPVRGYGTAERM